MRFYQWQRLCPRPGQAVWLLLPARFVLGFWLGAAVLPATALASLYHQGRLALDSSLPGAGPVSPALAPALLHSAGLPRLSRVQGGDGYPLILEAGREPEPVSREETAEAILVLTPAQAGLAPAAETAAPASQQAAPPQGQPRAVIYCTHTAEEYAGQTRQKGKAGGVLAVAQSLAQALEARGLAVIFDDSIHDQDYNSAYAHSLQALQAIQQEHPDIQLYIDVHRDSALAGISTTLQANGTDYAKLLLIVGSNQQLSHPDWQSNLAFAQELTAQAEALLPGLTRGEPRVYSGRYNQHLGRQAILVEFGSTDNSQEQAQRSAEVLAQAIMECLE